MLAAAGAGGEPNPTIATQKSGSSPGVTTEAAALTERQQQQLFRLLLPLSRNSFSVKAAAVS
jgi:hypothetical protein